MPTLYITSLLHLNSLPGQLGREIVSKTHFGGFGDEEEDEGVCSGPGKHIALIFTFFSSLLARNQKLK